MNRERVIAFGYIIADEQGRIQPDTFRTNRAACWKAFIGESTIRDKKEMKRQGFAAVPVWVKEHVEGKGSK